MKKRKLIDCKFCIKTPIDDRDFYISNGLILCQVCNDTRKILGEEHNYVECKLCDEEFQALDLTCLACNGDKEVIDPKEILCNLCGNTLCITMNANDWSIQEPYGLLNCLVSGGYNSLHLSDGYNYDFNLCELCLRNLFDQFKIKPKINCYLSGKFIEYDDELYEYKFRVWNQNGGAHNSYINELCNVHLECKNKAVYSQYYDDDFTEVCSCEEHKDKLKIGFPNYKIGPFVKNNLKLFL